MLALLVVAQAAAAKSDLLDLSIEELTDVRVTSVSRVEERLADAPAAVFVITGEEIRRAGVTTIAEALRMAPGVEVARRNAHSWSITIRGFNSDLSNKLLVLIDGRSVYSPLYAGVFWDVQDTLLEDIDRIEVISGPGGTLWGANAVNGVINIITRPAAATTGAFVEVGGGNEEQGFAGVRYGGKIGAVSARGYVKYLDRDSLKSLTGADGHDDARMAQGGFRLGWDAGTADTFTVQGDYYRGDETGVFQDAFTIGTLPAGSTEGRANVNGGNLLARWNRTFDGGADATLQAYYDHTRRDIPNTYDEQRDTVDLDFQHHFAINARHDALWGAGLRWTGDEIGNSALATFDPDERQDRTVSAFFQDKIEIKHDRVFLTLGSKFEHNDYTGFESQPNARVAWRMSGRQSLWGAVSHAVRIPARLDADLRLTVPLSAPTIPFPIYVTATGSRELDSEELEAYEIGYRIRTNEHLSFDIAAFRNDYDKLQTVEMGAPFVVVVPPAGFYAVAPNTLDDLMEGRSTGGTFAATWQPRDGLRLRFDYARLNMSLHTKPGSTDVTRSLMAGNSPERQTAVRSFVDLPHDLQFYAAARYVDKLPNLGVESYIAVDTSLTWAPSARLRTSLSIQNLNDARHLEFDPNGSNLIERNALLRLTWSL